MADIDIKQPNYCSAWNFKTLNEDLTNLVLSQQKMAMPDVDSNVQPPENELECSTLQEGWRLKPTAVIANGEMAYPAVILNLQHR